MFCLGSLMTPGADFTVKDHGGSTGNLSTMQIGS
jgi:hypothetical protein